MPFTSLPNELICMIGDFLRPSDISSLMQTNHRLYSLLQKTLLDSISCYEPDTWEHRGILTWACVHGREDLVRELMKREGHFFWVSWASHQFLYEAAAHGHANLIQILLEKAGTRPLRGSIMSSLQFAVGQAVRSGHLEALKLLLGYPDIKPWTERTGIGYSYELAFQNAADTGHIQIMRELLSLETTSGQFSSKPLHGWRQLPIYAMAETGLDGTFKFLLRIPYNTNEFGPGGNEVPLKLADAAGASCSIKVMGDTGFQVGIYVTVPGEPPTVLSWITCRIELSEEESLNRAQTVNDIRDMLRVTMTPPRSLEPLVAEAKKRQKSVLTDACYDGMSLQLALNRNSLLPFVPKIIPGAFGLIVASGKLKLDSK